jgi:tetratricopeptide (TPR) repeat protein
VFPPLILTVAALSACEQSPAFTAAHSEASNPAIALEARRHAYERSISICPEDPHLYREYGDLLLEQHLFDKALAWIQKGLALSPDNPDLRIAQAAALIPLNRPAEAIATLNGLLTPEAQFYRGMSYRLMQQHTKSRDAFLASWDAGYRNAYVLYAMIQEDYALHDKQNGLSHFELLLKTYPDSAWVHLLLADAYFVKGQNEPARAEYLKAIARKPDILEANFRLGYIAFQAGERDSALRYFQNEVTLNPGYADARVFLGETLLQLDRRPQAIEQFRAALALDSNSALAYKRLATLLVETNQLDQAKQELTKAAEKFPADPAFPAQLARVFTLMHQPKEAEIAAARARTLTAEQHRAHEALLNQ